MYQSRHTGKKIDDNIDLVDELSLQLEQNTDKITNLQAYMGYTDSDIYGIEVDLQNKKITRLAGAIGKTAGVDFDNINAYRRRRCNLADNGVVNAYYGDAGYKEDGSNGQVMVEQNKFYYKRVPLVLEPITGGIGYHMRKWRDYISDYPKAGFKLFPKFIVNGVEKEKIYLPAYEGSIYDVSTSTYLLNDEQVADFITDKLCSIANAKPASGLTQDLTRANSRKLANNRGLGWQILDIYTESAEQMLASIEYATFDLQTAIGLGIVSKTDDGSTNMANITGATSNLGNTSGMAIGTNGLVSVTYRGRENPWGNIWKWLDGFNLEAKGIHQAYISNYGFVDDIKTNPYKNCGFTLAKTNGYISAIGYSEFFDFGFLATETLGASNKPINDYFYQDNTYNGFLVGRLGGGWSDSVSAGLWYLYAYNASGARARTIGSALLYIPQ